MWPSWANVLKSKNINKVLQIITKKKKTTRDYATILKLFDHYENVLGKYLPRVFKAALQTRQEQVSR